MVGNNERYRLAAASSSIRSGGGDGPRARVSRVVVAPLRRPQNLAGEMYQTLEYGHASDALIDTQEPGAGVPITSRMNLIIPQGVQPIKSIHFTIGFVRRFSPSIGCHRKTLPAGNRQNLIQPTKWLRSSRLQPAKASGRLPFRQHWLRSSRSRCSIQRGDCHSGGVGFVRESASHRLSAGTISPRWLTCNASEKRRHHTTAWIMHVPDSLARVPRTLPRLWSSTHLIKVISMHAMICHLGLDRPDHPSTALPKKSESRLLHPLV